MLRFILIAVAAILLTIGLVKLVDKYIPSKYKPVLNIALWVLIAFLGYQTYMSVYTPILFNQEKNKRYAKVIKNLIDIRDSELAYKQVNGKFTDSFDELVKFIETAKFTITQRRDSVVIDKELTKRYGVETTKDIVVIDTLGYVPVKDSLFKNSTRYKTMMNVPTIDIEKYDEWVEGLPIDTKIRKDFKKEMQAGKIFKLQAGFLRQNDINIPVFEASVSKDVLFYDKDEDLINTEKQVVSTVVGVPGDAIKVGSMNEVTTSGNWPKTYGANE